MIKHTGFHPEINKLLDELEDLKDSSQYRANLIISPDYCDETEDERRLRRARAQSTADAYSYCQLRLRMLNI